MLPVRRLSVLLCLVQVLSPSVPGQSSAALSPDRVPAGLRADDWAGVRAAYDAGRHAAFRVDEGYQARSPGQQWLARFDGRGFTTHPDSGDWSWGLELLRYGFAGQEQAVGAPARVSAAGSRVAYDWDATLQEWYVNDARGLEHGYTVHRSPPRSDADAGPLTLTLAVRGDLLPEVEPDGAGALFRDGHGAAVVRYVGLTVLDAGGRSLPARLERCDEGLRLIVDEAGAPYPLTIDPIAQQAYLKASNPGSFDQFGEVLAISGDTVVIGASLEYSNATGVNGNQSDNSAQYAGAAYVFVRNGATWTQQAYLKASNTEALDQFGRAVAISGDTVVVGAWLEDCSSVGVNGSQTNNDALSSGAAYVFVRTGTTWSQQAYLKASNTGANDWFGRGVAISGNTLVVGAQKEASSATGVNGNQASNSLPGSGAVYVFVRNGTTWSQQAYLKASSTDMDDLFGSALALSGDTLVVGASSEDSAATGVNGDESDDSVSRAGAAYVFQRTAGVWSQQAYLKPSATPTPFEDFGLAVSVSNNAVVVGSPNEDSNATGVDGDDNDNSVQNSGAAYVFVRNGSTWSQQAYLKASNTGAGDNFGQSVAVSGNLIAVGALFEDGSATGINGLPDDTAGDAGAAYLFVRSGTTWSPLAYLKASNTDPSDRFGIAVAASADTVVAGAYAEASSAPGVNGNQADDSLPGAGAAYAFDLDLLPEPWADLGLGLAGVHGVPQLAGRGTLIGGDSLILTLGNARPNTGAVLVIGASAIHAPYKGGTFVPNPHVLVFGLPTDSTGDLLLAGTWPTDMPSGDTFFLQFWIPDPAGPAGFSASNAISATTP